MKSRNSRYAVASFHKEKPLVKTLNGTRVYHSNRMKELLFERRKIQLLPRLPRIPVEYYKVLVRELTQENISGNYAVGHGLIYDEIKEEHSPECDVIVFNSEIEPIFQHRDLVIVNPRNVRFVMQVKHLLNSNALRNAIKNLKSVKALNRQISCWVIGFETNVLLKTLYLKAWKSKTVDFLNVFVSKGRKTENRQIIENQMKFFVQLLRYYGKSPIGKYPKGLTIGINKEGQFIRLEEGEKEEEIRNYLSEMYQNIQRSQQ